MFNSSLRRAAQTCPNAALTARPTKPTGSITTATFSTHRHQRRHSSSKPPIPPNDGSASIPATSVKTVGTPRTTEKRAGAESRLSKRKAVKGDKQEQIRKQETTLGNEWTMSMPSVPSTQHLNPKDVYVASFFSTHRPISISGPLPPETQIEDFDKIFQARKKQSRNGSSDVIYTLSNVVQNLEENVQNQQQESGVEQRADIIKALTQQNNPVQHVDGQPTQIRTSGSVKMVIEEMARRFRPFNPPPAPEAMSEVLESSKELIVEGGAAEEMLAQQLQAEIETQDQVNPRQQISIDLDSGRFFTSHQSPNVTDPSKQAKKGGRARRGVYVDPGRSLNNLRYHLISVKRQRKLKMKKHKHKKLMRKTRNLRRREDRL